MSDYGSRPHSPNHNEMNPNNQNQNNQNPVLPVQEKFQYRPPQQGMPLREQYYPIRIVQPSVIVYPVNEENNFKLKSSFIQGVPKFMGFENAYEFLNDFELYSSILRMQQL